MPPLLLALGFGGRVGPFSVIVPDAVPDVVPGCGPEPGVPGRALAPGSPVRMPVASFTLVGSTGAAADGAVLGIGVVAGAVPVLVGGVRVPGSPVR